MQIEFKALKVGNRFSNTFENWTENNKLDFEDKKIISVYASNGVGKSSFAKALKNELQASFVYEYDSKIYTEKSKTSPVMVIDDFFFRNIAVRENERLSDYILGTEINKELALREKIIKVRENIRSNIIEMLKNEYGIKTKSSKIIELLSDSILKKFISALANVRDKGKNDYNEKEFIELLKSFRTEKVEIQDAEKYAFVKESLKNDDSIIIPLITFDIDSIRPVEGFSKLDINNDAIEILKKHKNLDKCIFDESHLLSNNVKEELENNKRLIINQLTSKQKDLVEKVLNSTEQDLLNIKEIFNTAFELGETQELRDLVTKIKYLISLLEINIKENITKIIIESKLSEIQAELMELINNKVELTEADSILLKEIITNCINKPVTLERDENKNIIFKIGDSEVIGKTRQELPLSTGEQNFVSLYFELLAAKNSDRDIIIIDDPISSFDSIYKNKIIYAILRVLSEKKVIVLTHNINTIKLMHHQYSNCFNMYLLNNQSDGTNGFVRINRRTTQADLPKDLDLILEIKMVLELLSDVRFVNDIKNKEQFLVSLIPFMRSYANILNTPANHYSELSQLMHGYESTKIDINKKYNDIFGIDLLGRTYQIDVIDILKLSVVEEIVDMNKYPLFNRTLNHILRYLKLRLLVESTLYNIDTTKIRVDRHPKLHQVIDIYLKDKPDMKSKFVSKKTLLNEFNHFEYDMCIFMPSLDISDYKLAEEEKDIIKSCNDIIQNGL